MRDLANVGFGYGLVRKHVWIEKLCLLVTVFLDWDS